MNPFMAFCLYICGRVFVQYLKARRDDQQIQTSLNFVLQAMHTMKRWNGLTESFIAQLDLDLEAAGIANPHYQGSLENIIKKGVVSWLSHYSPCSQITTSNGNANANTFDSSPSSHVTAKISQT